MPASTRASSSRERRLFADARVVRRETHWCLALLGAAKEISVSSRAVSLAFPRPDTVRGGLDHGRDRRRDVGEITMH